MTSWTTRLFFLLVALAGLARAQPGPVVVGAAVSESGAHAEAAADYRKALLLWQDEVNAAGGLLGRKVELRLLDDASEAIRTGELYVQLIREDKVDLLIGPYGTAASMMAAAEVESARRVMVNGAGPSRAVHKRSPRYVFQSVVPYNAYGAGALELARAQGHKNLYLIARDDPVAREMAEGTKEKALKLGFAVPDIELFQAGADDFLVQVKKARSLQADAWIAFGEARDAAEMIKALKKERYAPSLFFSRGASEAQITKRVGQDAELAIGALEYDTRFRTEGNMRFVEAFSARYGALPGHAGAEGYAAGTVLAAGVLHAGSFDQEKLRAALGSLSIPTVLGGYKVDPLTGEQLAAQPALTQIQRGRVELVWPAELATAKPVLPYPDWGARKLLK